MLDDKNYPPIPPILGRKVKDKITGFTGTAVVYCMYLTGCARVGVQPPVDKDGKLPEQGHFDILSLEIIEDEPAVVDRTHTDNGGPQAPIPRRSFP